MIHLGRQAAPQGSLADIVFQRVGRQIADGELSPGDSVNDNAIAAAMGVSRTPVREALQRLERIGMIVLAPSRYTRVTSLADDEVAGWREFIGQQLSVLSRTASIRLADAAREDAARRVDEMATCVSDPDRYARAAVDLYGHLALQSLNDVHRALVEETSFALIRALRAWVVEPHVARRVEGALQHLGAALRAGDGDVAERSARAAYLIE
ncbi:GntR family transcriptional regulator [Microbacterium sp. C5A9]|uniref:GntR family transcriptional regulator n=1 Tax=Microbacterium sp. C5A9 TaxID=2736663 RepID=UPI001F51F248|nr:GntR family transcriptional regulator [Microbacterium sp. C5A9]MCI1018570.1 GntR family transcriptional regulator [Microbacterium sp. C5A9]